jgi:hypothetical protein
MCFIDDRMIGKPSLVFSRRLVERRCSNDDSSTSKNLHNLRDTESDVRPAALC